MNTSLTYFYESSIDIPRLGLNATLLQTFRANKKSAPWLLNLPIDNYAAFFTSDICETFSPNSLMNTQSL